MLALLIAVLIPFAFRGKKNSNRTPVNQDVFEQAVEELVVNKMNKYGLSRDEATRIILGE